LLEPAVSSVPLALYLHIPFCTTRCDYCDFYSTAGGAESQVFYIRGLIAELDKWRWKRPDFFLDTIYIGGGTPSVIKPSLWQPLLDAISRWPQTNSPEFTIEANPETLRPEHLDIWQQGGVNRLSLGVQSSSEAIRQALGRGTSDKDLQRVRNLVSSHWQGRISLDWMTGFPRGGACWFGGKPPELREEWDYLKSWNPDHISCYELILEEGTLLARKGEQGGLIMPDEETLHEEQAEVSRLLASHGLNRYEVSNYARTGCESRHNLHYWRWEPYLGLGNSAHSLINSTPGKGDFVHLEVDRDDVSRYHTLEALTPREAVKEEIR